jgi:hypothetical protein
MIQKYKSKLKEHNVSLSLDNELLLLIMKAVEFAIDRDFHGFTGLELKKLQKWLTLLQDKV